MAILNIEVIESDLPMTRDQAETLLASADNANVREPLPQDRITFVVNGQRLEFSGRQDEVAVLEGIIVTGAATLNDDATTLLIHSNDVDSGDPVITTKQEIIARAQQAAMLAELQELLGEDAVNEVIEANRRISA